MTEHGDREVRRLRRSVILLGAAGLFFVASAGLHLVQTGSIRFIDIVVPLWGLLFASYWRRFQAAQKRRGGTGPR